jgi:hypothetical protein
MGATGGAAGGTPDAGHDAPDDVRRDDGATLDAGSDVAIDGEPDGAPPTGCVPPFMSTICDPVCNTGCTALLRCDITIDLPRTGVCVGTLLSMVGEGMPCTRSTVTDDCLERLSCVEGTCRRLCYRDSDCTTAGTCCNTSIDIDGGASGYRYCAPCMP